MCSIKEHEIEFENETTRSPQRAGRVPGTHFSWTTRNETNVAALPRSLHQDDGKGQRHPARGYREVNERLQFLFCC